MDYKIDNNANNITHQGCCKCSASKLGNIDWMSDIPSTGEEFPYVEVQFKNIRKGFYLNSNNIPLEKGDIVAVEASPGHDIGTVTLTGKIVQLQMKKLGFDPNQTEIKRVYRKARQVDLEKYEEAKSKEQDAMLRSRQIAANLNLDMKIGDVEYQGDGNKAIFYYIADERVDFRQLIKVLADTFKVRIEMRQIGARQEAGRIGGIGPCGRPLCCSSWINRFVSVGTGAARRQDISLNPQKLAGQCAKLKCCINYELDTYNDALKDFPSKEIPLETIDGTFYYCKSDIFAKKMTYSSDPHVMANLVTLPIERVKEIIELNKKGVKVDSLVENNDNENKKPQPDFQNVVGQDSLTRFDKKKKKKKKKKHSNNEDQNSSQNNPKASNNEEHK